MNPLVILRRQVFPHRPSKCVSVLSRRFAPLRRLGGGQLDRPPVSGIPRRFLIPVRRVLFRTQPCVRTRARLL